MVNSYNLSPKKTVPQLPYLKGCLILRNNILRSWIIQLLARQLSSDLPQIRLLKSAQKYTIYHKMPMLVARQERTLTIDVGLHPCQFILYLYYLRPLMG